MQVTREQILQARKANLPQYLDSIGINVIKDGGRYRHPNHNSLVFKNNSYFWNSKQDSGNSLDFLTKHLEKDFKTAVLELCNIAITAEIEPLEQEQIKLNKNTKRAIAYLIKARGISANTIIPLIKRGMILQTLDHNNILFPIYNGNSIIGGELCGTLTEHRFKGILPNSPYGLGYSLSYGRDNICFFESAIDMLSYIDIGKKQNPNFVEKTTFVSMAGLKSEVVKKSLEMLNSPHSKVYMCTDNDKASNLFLDTLKRKIEGVNFIKHLPPPDYKDWNEYLVKKGGF